MHRLSQLLARPAAQTLTATTRQPSASCIVAAVGATAAAAATWRSRSTGCETENWPACKSPSVLSQKWKRAEETDGVVIENDEEVNPFLLRFLDELIPYAKPADWVSTMGPRVFFPFCGKTVDMAFLAARGCRVVGFDHVPDAKFERTPNAIREFTAAHGTTGSSEELELPEEIDSKRFKAYMTEVHGDGTCPPPPVLLVEGDFLSVTPAEAEAFVPFGAAFDSGALISMPPAQQRRYAQALSNFIAPDGRVLMLSVEKHAAQHSDGPPYAPDMQQLFGEAFELRLLLRDDVDDESLREAGQHELRLLLRDDVDDESLREAGQHGCVYLLTKRMR